MTNRKTLFEDKVKTFEIVADVLYELGFPRHLTGYDYLCQAVTEVLCGYECYGVTKNLYPYIAKNNGTSSIAVERSIRVAIGKVCDAGGERIRSLSNTPDGALHFSNREFILAAVKEIQKRYSR